MPNEQTERECPWTPGGHWCDDLSTLGIVEPDDLSECADVWIPWCEAHDDSPDMQDMGAVGGGFGGSD